MKVWSSKSASGGDRAWTHPTFPISASISFQRHGSSLHPPASHHRQILKPSDWFSIASVVVESIYERQALVVDCLLILKGPAFCDTRISFSSFVSPPSLFFLTSFTFNQLCAFFSPFPSALFWLSLYALPELVLNPQKLVCRILGPLFVRPE